MEMAVVLLIMGFLLSGLLVSVSQNAENNRRTDASAKMESIQEALYGFAQTTGRLPCPAAIASAGAESRDGSNNCTQWHGFVPAATLGITGSVNGNGLLLDLWGNPYRYSIGSGFFAPAVASLTTVFANWPTTLPNPGLRVCLDETCSDTIANNIPAVVLSMGANWAQYTSAAEVANAGAVAQPPGTGVTTTNIFVSTTYDEDNFDDIVLWLSPNILFTRMISAGKLP